MSTTADETEKIGFTGSETCNERVTLRIPEAQLEQVDDHVVDPADGPVGDDEFPNRSEAIRHAIDAAFGGDADA
jgi:metal-responsive CopG/Arc/MetJ family transcriptional regulator